MIKRNLIISLFALLASGGLIFVYSNHFHNGFHFDDSHSLVNNIYIRDLKNIPLFFKDSRTLSSLPANQAYRPLMPTFYAIDYALGKGLNDTFQFHLTTFIFYVAQCILMFFIFLKIFNAAQGGTWNGWLALFATVLYAFHTANAETINYISARSDSLSTFFVVLAMFVFMYSGTGRKWQLYLLAAVLGILVKPAALVFPGLLFFYLFLFDAPKRNEGSLASQFLHALLYTLPSLVICGGLYIFQAKMTPPTFIPGGSRFSYLITQPYVSLHYFKNFFFPDDLSADTDWVPLPSVTHPKFIIGMLFIALMGLAAFYTWKRKELRPVSYGIVWFFIALLPSSSIIPFAEVMNDHRTFFPYIGLVMSVAWLAGFLLQRSMDAVLSLPQKSILAVCALTIIGGHAWGTRERNKVWKDDESLWYDVTMKSPKNGRGHLNYGLALMQKGDYANAEKEYLLGLDQWPYYSYLHINMGILKSVQNKLPEAEQYFRNGITYGSENPEAYYYYADFLYNHGRKQEALPLLEKCVQLSPAHTWARYLLMAIYADNYRWDDLQRMASETLAILPGDLTSIAYLEASRTRKTKLDVAAEKAAKNPTPENYLQLSLEYYNAGKYGQCVEAAQQALKLKPGYAEAWNNICSAYNQLGLFEEAEKACALALQLKPGYSLAQNNLNNVIGRRVLITAALDIVQKKRSPENYLNLSLAYYNAGLYEKCIEACREALKLKPDYADAWNNICSAYNQMKNWDEAIKAGEEAVRLRPGFQLAINNLLFARQQKQLAENKK